nr:reverse transcriptase domain-containing protein [Tanacetum cinerariifolium]
RRWENDPGRLGAAPELLTYVSRPEVMVTFPIVYDKDGAAFVAQTTTPWTLPSNLALCVNSNFVYVKLKSKSNGKIYVVAESLLSKLPTEMPKKGTHNGSTVGKAKNTTDAYEIVEKFPGSSLMDTFRIVADDYVTATSGTRIVHLAPQFGENLVMPVDDDGCFTERITRFSGGYIKDVEKDIIQAVKASIVTTTFATIPGINLGFSGRLVAGIPFPGDISPGISGTEKIE